MNLHCDFPVCGEGSSFGEVSIFIHSFSFFMGIIVGFLLVYFKKKHMMRAGSLRYATA